MAVDSLNASELAIIAQEAGADIFQGALRYPSDTGGWLVGDLDLYEYLDRYRNRQVMVIVAPLGPAPAPSYTCGICGFVYSERGERPRCRMASEQGLLTLPGEGEGQDILDQLRDLLDEAGK